MGVSLFPRGFHARARARAMILWRKFPGKPEGKFSASRSTRYGFDSREIVAPRTHKNSPLPLSYVNVTRTLAMPVTGIENELVLNYAGV